MPTIKLIIIIISCIIICQCAEQNNDTSGSTVTTSGAQSDNLLARAMEKAQAENSGEGSSAINSYEKVSIGDRFNRNQLIDRSDPEDSGKTFRIKRIPYYTVIYADWRKEVWPGHSKAMENFFNECQWYMPFVEGAIIGTTLALPFSMLSMPTLATAAIMIGGGASSGTGIYEQSKNKSTCKESLFNAPPAESSALFTIHQAKTTAALDESSILNFETYRSIGHTVSALDEYPNKKEIFPEEKTAVIASIGDPQETYYDMMAPIDYELVYKVTGEDFAQVQAQCQTGTYMMNDPRGMTICPHTQGLIGTQMYDYAIQLQRTAIKRNLALWKPIPPKGYKCLGYLATNNWESKPRFFMGAAGDLDSSYHYQTYTALVKAFGESATTNFDNAIWCIAESYLTLARIDDIPVAEIETTDIFDSNKKFKVFIVKTKALTKDDSGYKEDEPGYDGLNTFQVIYTSNPDLSNWPNIKRLYELQRICHTVPFSEKAECKDKADLDESFLFWTFKKNIIREMPDLEKTTTTPQ